MCYIVNRKHRTTVAKLTIINGKSILVLFTVLVLLLLPKDNYSFRGKEISYKIKTVVIDAGHGGHDPGTIGYSKTKEKTVALAVALKVGGYIKEYYPDVNVVYTRDTDKFVELHERAGIANRSGADLFISIHCNAFSSSSVYGTEVYVLGLHKSEENLSVAKRENSVILMEDDYNDRYDGFDPSKPEGHILFSMFQDAFINQSINFAEKVDNQFKNRVNRRSRGVKQAGFIVLWKTSMPSTLIELGFISNQSEESFLTTEQGQSYMASAIYRAFKEYKLEMEKNVPFSESGEDNTPTPPAPKPDNTNPAPTPKPEPKPTVTETPKPATDHVVYKIQFLASDTELKADDPKFKGLKDISSVFVSGLHKYMTGNYGTYDEALKQQGQVRKLGFSDAFMVAYLKGERISISEAQAKQNK